MYRRRRLVRGKVILNDTLHNDLGCYAQLDIAGDIREVIEYNVEEGRFRGKFQAGRSRTFL